MKRKLCFIIALCFMLTGCQKTPDESAVVSKADGLREDVIAEPLAESEKVTLDVPSRWEMEDKRSNDRVTISAELDLGTMEAGNLPVIEKSNHELSQQELEDLVSYFSKDQKLYVPNVNTKEVYQYVIDRIENQEGSYANTFMASSYRELKDAVTKAKELAPETNEEPELAEVKFQKPAEDPAKAASEDWSGGRKPDADSEAEDYFAADVGSEREAHIEAERYDSKLENSSRFVWRNGAAPLLLGDIQQTIDNWNYAGIGGYAEKITGLYDQYQACLEQSDRISEEDGKTQAKQLLEDLGISNMEVSSIEPGLWVPYCMGYKVREIGFGEDYYWQVDLEQAVSGYQYTFSSYINGIPAKRTYGTVSEQTTESYIPPFPVETITIDVTKDGVQSFKWEGMTEEVKTIAENTNLLPFEKVQNQLADQIFYWYAQMGQPANDTTQFEYKVTDAELLYTYVPAYGEPKDAWLVPAWAFTVGYTSNGEETPWKNWFVINALDGGVIGRAD